METKLFFCEPTQTVAQQRYLMLLKGVMEVCPTLSLDILVANLMNNTVHVPKQMVLCFSSDAKVNIIDPYKLTTNAIIRYTQCESLQYRPNGYAKAQMSQNSANIWLIVAKYLQNTLIIVPHLSPWLNISKECGMFIDDNLIQPPMESGYFFEKPS